MSGRPTCDLGEFITAGIARSAGFSPGSSGANLFASIAAGINALWGPLHGGANQTVIEMLERTTISSAAGSIRTSTFTRE